jgi:glycerol-1-phosphate dehydrogenase [NAD(P)+]
MMELPRKVLVGQGVIGDLGIFVKDLGPVNRVLIVTGPHVKQKVGRKAEESLSSSGLTAAWFVAENATKEVAEQIAKKASSERVSYIIGLGGGKSVDLSKLAAFYSGIPFVSVPTSASHDGMSSPFASIKGLDKPYSLVARPPAGILADIDVIADAPRRLILSGCGDLVAKITAVKDWELARDDRGEYYGRYAASLALLGAEMFIENASRWKDCAADDVREIVEALISGGVAAGIAGSSRPCSGSEHLVSHALDLIAPNKGLHGEKCGIGTILMAKLHGLDWEKVSTALKSIGSPSTAGELGVDASTLVKAIVMAPSVRPERYTILSKARLTEKDALELVRSAEVA